MQLEQAGARGKTGRRPIGRHIFIGMLYFLIQWNVIIPFLVRTGETGVRGALMAILLLSPPLIALLVIFIDREGPLRNWAVLFLLVLLYPAVALNHDAVVLFEYLAYGRTPALWPTLLLNLSLLPASVLCGRKMVPRSCPSCGRHTLVPLMRLLKKEKRSANTRWCASCGGQFWKDAEGNWRVERRKTWWDARNEPSKPGKSLTGSESGSAIEGPMGHPPGR